MSNKSQSFVERVISLIKGGDETKIRRFHSKVVKFLEKQIAACKADNDNLSEKIADAQEQLDDTLVSVKMDDIKTTDDANAHVEPYIRKVQSCLDAISALEEEQEDNNEQIAKFQNILDLLK